MPYPGLIEEAARLHLAALGVEDRARLVNEAAPGLGRDDAPVIVMGTEHAYNLDDPKTLEVLATEDCVGDRDPGRLASSCRRRRVSGSHPPSGIHTCSL